MRFNPSSSLFHLLNAPMRPGQIIWLGVRPGRREAVIPLQKFELDLARGVIGDRYSRAAGSRQVTLIQAEHLEAIASHLGQPEVAPEDLRRNIVTRGINLLALKDKRFRVGTAVLEKTGECHPCSRMEEILGVGGYNAVRGLGGITARVVATGTVSVNDEIAAIELKQ